MFSKIFYRHINLLSLRVYYSLYFKKYNAGPIWQPKSSKVAYLKKIKRSLHV